MGIGQFHKMHGLGNDFVIIDCRPESGNVPIIMTPAKARAIADRKTGIGCDQLILIEPSDTADIAMRIYNFDGSEVQSCGNASRCVVALIGHDITIETAGGHIKGQIGEGSVSIDMGAPRFEWEAIPLAFAMDTAKLPLAWNELSAPMAVNVGNPHAVFFVDDSKAVDLIALGPMIEHDAAFPERINVNVASFAGGAINLRVWERGVGETRACGTGACATAVAAIKQGRVQSPVQVHLPGGTLTIAWQVGGNIQMTGGTTYVFAGQADWDAF
jgi:diaminopimelate epimerase